MGRFCGQVHKQELSTEFKFLHLHKFCDLNCVCGEGYCCSTVCQHHERDKNTRRCVMLAERDGIEFGTSGCSFMKLATVWYLTWTASYLAIFFKAFYQGIKWHFCSWNWIKAGDLQGLSCNATAGSSPNISSALLHDSNWNQGTFSYTVTKILLLFGLFYFGSAPLPQIFVISQQGQGFFLLEARGKGSTHTKKAAC